MTSLEKQYVIFFIGYNTNGEFGLGHSNSMLKQFIVCPNKSIRRVYSGNAYSIYADKNRNNLWAAGYNLHGQCCIGKFEQATIEYTPITFFKEKQISIKKVCINIAGECVFFISDKNQLYGCGANNQGILGLPKGNINTPQIMKTMDHPLENVIDARTTVNYGIALCSTNNEIIYSVIQNWCRIYTIPHDITNVIVMFCKSRTVYSTTQAPGSGQPDSTALFSNDGWNVVEILNDKDIINIATGNTHTLFLGFDGNIWSCGDDYPGDGVLGLGLVAETGSMHESVTVPTLIKYFNIHKIKIVDIQCGCNHNLALDANGKVYAWGSNEYGELGIGNTQDRDVPEYVSFFERFHLVVDTIKCGYHHSFVKTVCGKNMLFGSNEDNECLTFNKECIISLPYQIDNIVKRKCRAKIIDVDPGYFNTKIICISE